MNYAIIRVRLPVVKNIRIKEVIAESDDDSIHWLKIETVRYFSGKVPASTQARKIGKSKRVAAKRARKRKAVA